MENIKKFMIKYFTKENITTFMGITALIINYIGVVNVPMNLIDLYNIVAILLIVLGYDKEQIKQIIKTKGV